MLESLQDMKVISTVIPAHSMAELIKCACEAKYSHFPAFYQLYSILIKTLFKLRRDYCHKRRNYPNIYGILSDATLQGG